MSSDAVVLPFGTCPAPVRETERILVAHGSGGRLTSELIETLFLPMFRNPALEALEDQAIMALPGGGRIAFTTDSYVVTPRVFPGGDIGSLAVHGTINDLAMSGARPLALSLAFILEEGLPLDELRRHVETAAAAASTARVPIVTGDTKVVERGHGDGLYINTSGVGILPPELDLGTHRIRAGDAVLLSGTIGDHGIAVMAQRQGLELEGEVRSDSAALHGLTAALLEACREVHAMRDPTRGGVAATLVEIAARRRIGIELDESSVPVRDVVRGASELLGLDPLLLANEGKLVAFVAADHADAALAALRAHPLGRDATRVGRVGTEHPGLVVVKTPFGGRRILDLPLTEPLPRIC